MFGSTKNVAAPDQKAYGVDVRRTATNEQARPLPYFAGLQRLGSTFLSSLCDVRTEEIREKVGKSQRVVGHRYFASFALLHARGPADKLFKILMDDEVVWTGEVTRSSDYADITVEGRGTVRFYWGTATQTVDAYLNASDPSHPAYRGQFYSVWTQLYLGDNRTNVPNIEIIAGRYPDPTWCTATTNLDKDANPIAFLGDLLQDPYVGLGLPDARLDTAGLNAVAQTLAAEDLGLSPLLTRSQSLRQILAETFEYLDAYLTSKDDGKLTIGLVRAPAAPGSLTVVDEGDLTEELQPDPGSWGATLNDALLVYSNREIDLLPEPLPWIDRGNFQITGHHKSQTWQRPWITRQSVAQRIVRATGRRYGLPELVGRASVRKSVGKALRPGTQFKLTYAHQDLVALIVRVSEQILPAPGKPPVVQIAWAVDRGYLSAANYVPSPDTPPSAPSLEPIANAYEKILEMPWTREFAVPQIAALAARGNALATGLRCHHRKPSGAYEEQGASPHFTQRGHVVDANYPATTPTIDDDIGLVVQLDGVDATVAVVPFADALQDELLLFVDGEICSAFGAVLLAAGKYRIYLIRGRYDTRSATHNINAEVWITRRTSVAAFHANSSEATQTYKLQPFSPLSAVDLADVTALALTTTHRWQRPLAPVNLRAGGDRAHPAYSTGQNVGLAWTQTHEARERFWFNATSGSGWGNFGATPPATVIEFRTTGGVLKQTIEVAAGTSSYTLTNANLVSWYGSEQDLVVRAWHFRGGFRSTDYTELTILKT